MKHAVATLILLLAAVATINGQSSEYRQYDGSDINPLGGHANDYYTRYSDRFFYGDGISSPTGNDRENARIISNVLFARPSKLNTRNVNALHNFFGMAVGSDLVDSQPGAEPMQIDVPLCDAFYDVACEGDKTMGMSRQQEAPGTGTDALNPRRQVNMVTAFIDGSYLYGNNEDQNAGVREFEGGRLLNDWIAAPDPPLAYGNTQLKRRSDGRMNVTPGVACTAEVFIREHNRLAGELAAEHPDWSDEQLFQETRRWLIAFIQSITMRQYLATLLGEPLPPYEGFKSDVDPTLDATYTYAAGRYGHPQVTTVIERRGANLDLVDTQPALVRDNFFSWAQMLYGGFDEGLAAVIRGLIVAPHNSPSSGAISEDMRNFFLGGPTQGAFDIAAVNIVRGREVGLPTLNEARELLGLAPHVSFDSVTGGDDELSDALASLYASADDIDLFVGGLCEQPTRAGTDLGDTFWRILFDTFLRTRDGDSMWFERDGAFTDAELQMIYNTTFDVLIKRNTPVGDEIGSGGVFFRPQRQIDALLNVNTGLFFEPSRAYVNERQITPIYKMWWTVDATRGVIDFEFQIFALGWFGVGFHRDEEVHTMKGADIVLMRVLDNGDGSGTVEARDSFALDVGVPTLDTDLAGGTDDVFDVAGEQGAGWSRVRFSRRLDTGDADFDRPIRDGLTNVIFAYNPDTDELRYHGPTRNANNLINFYEGQELVELPVAVQVIVGIAGSVGLLLVVFFAIVIYTHYEHFRYSQPPIIAFILLGASLLLGGVLTLIKDAPNSASCIAYIWLVGIGFAVFYAAQLAKAFRIWRVYTAATNFKKIAVTHRDAIGWISSATLIVVVYLALFTALGDPTAELRTTDYDDDKVQWQCVEPTGWWIGAVCGIGVFVACGALLSLLSRKLPSGMGDAKPLALSLYNMLLVACICIPLGFVLAEFQVAVVLVKSIGPAFSAIFTLVAFFASPTYRVLRGAGASEFAPSTSAFSGTGGSPRSHGGRGSASLAGATGTTGS
jgi:Animal haem peroxidase/7 transmembrane sweet-taste receptor of 3 GCPR/DOMON domain